MIGHPPLVPNRSILGLEGTAYLLGFILAPRIEPPNLPSKYVRVRHVRYRMKSGVTYGYSGYVHVPNHLSVNHAGHNGVTRVSYTQSIRFGHEYLIIFEM